MQDRFHGNLLVASTTVPNPLFEGGVGLIVHQDDDHTIGVMLNRPLNPQAVVPVNGIEDKGESASERPRFDTNLISSEFVDLESDEFEEERDEPFFDAPSDLENHEATELSPSSPTDFSPKEILANHPNNDLADFLNQTLPQLHFGGPMSGPVVAIHQSSEYAEMETGSGIFIAAHRDHLEQLLQKNQNPCRLIVGHLRWEADRLQDEIDAGWWHTMPATADRVFSPAVGMWERLVRPATERSMRRWIGIPDLNSPVLWN